MRRQLGAWALGDTAQASASGARRRQASGGAGRVCARQERRWRAWGVQAASARGRWESGLTAGAALARGARARGRSAAGTGRSGRAAWAQDGQDCALGAVGLFLARFDSVLFMSQIFGHGS